MKSTRSKKQVLNNDLLEKEFFEDVLLLGIVCPLPSYRFAWHIERALGLAFRREHEYEINVQENFFEVYRVLEEERMVEHILYINRKKTAYLLDDMRHVDFIWMVKSNWHLNQYRKVLPDKVSGIAVVDYCFLINPMALKSRQHLIL